jgi:hypothetical protein
MAEAPAVYYWRLEAITGMRQLVRHLPDPDDPELIHNVAEFTDLVCAMAQVSCALLTVAQLVDRLLAVAMPDATMRAELIAGISAPLDDLLRGLDEEGFARPPWGQG